MYQGNIHNLIKRSKDLLHLTIIRLGGNNEISTIFFDGIQINHRKETKPKKIKKDLLFNPLSKGNHQPKSHVV